MHSPGHAQPQATHVPRHACPPSQAHIPTPLQGMHTLQACPLGILSNSSMHTCLHTVYCLPHTLPRVYTPLGMHNPRPHMSPGMHAPLPRYTSQPLSRACIPSRHVPWAYCLIPACIHVYILSTVYHTHSPGHTHLWACTAPGHTCPQTCMPPSRACTPPTPLGMHNPQSCIPWAMNAPRVDRMTHMCKNIRSTLRKLRLPAVMMEKNPRFFFIWRRT